MCGDGGIYTIASEYIAWLESIGGEIDGAVDGGTEAGLDADPTCLPLSAACHPLTNEGCDSQKGEACRIDSAGFSCHPAPNEAQPGGLCDQSSRFCVQGYHCGASLRCERVCCSDSDCPKGGPCTPLSATGTLGTCGVEIEDAGPEASVDAGAAGASGAGGAGGTGGEAGMAGTGGSEADAGPDAQPSKPGDSDVDEDGCGCRTAGTKSSGAAWWVVAFGLALLGRWRSKR
jgi:MYXO-CTERM domain-containing protein